MRSTTVKIRYYETDMMGIMHHTNHLRLFELGRVEYLREAGIDLLQLMAMDIVTPIRNIDCQYKATATFDDYIRIETSIHKLSPAQVTFTYRLVRESDDVLIATGKTQNAFMYGKTGKIAKLPAELYENLLKMAQEDLV